jgi:hypothetical protein
VLSISSAQAFPDLTFGGILRDDMRAFHAEPNAIKRDEIAARQLHALKRHNASFLTRE